MGMDWVKEKVKDLAEATEMGSEKEKASRWVMGSVTDLDSG
jgi:hypothetical protein